MGNVEDVNPRSGALHGGLAGQTVFALQADGRGTRFRLVQFAHGTDWGLIAARVLGELPLACRALRRTLVACRRESQFS